MPACSCFAGVVVDGPSKVHVCERCHVPHEELGGVAEILAATGAKTRRSVLLWRRGEQLGSRGPFPKPVAELAGGPVWDLRAVRAWARSK